MEKSGKLFKIGVIILLIFGIITVAMFAYVQQATSIETTKVEKVFTDINQDGSVDLLIEGKVIFNNPNPTPPQSP